MLLCRAAALSALAVAFGASALLAFGCSAMPPAGGVPPGPSAVPSQSSPADAASSTAPVAAPPPVDSAGATRTVPAPSAPALGTAEPPPAHSVSTLTGPPAATNVPTAVPGAAPTPDELHVIAMCQGKASMFSDKELKLLKLAESGGDENLRATAGQIRLKRQADVASACERLRAAGKL